MTHADEPAGGRGKHAPAEVTETKKHAPKQPHLPGERKGGKSREELESLRKRLEEETARVDELRASLVRLQADFENYRKRSTREREESQKFANEKLILEVVDILGNFDRAIEASSGSDSLHEGISLILKQFHNLLAREGVERIEAEGKKFDPQLHEAAMREETTDYADGVVIMELEKGWKLHGKVIRAAKVKVAVRRPA